MIKTYTAIVKITFKTLENKNPRVIAKNMANIYNCMRGLNLHTFGTVEKIVEELDR